MSFLDTLSAGYKASSPSSFRFPTSSRGFWPYSQGGYSNSSINWAQKAGPLWQNSIVLASLGWQARTYPEAVSVVHRKDAKGEVQTLTQHPALDILNKPVQFKNYNLAPSLMWNGANLSLAVNGNGYFYKLRSAAGKVLSLIYIPHFWMSADSPNDGSNFINRYVYRPNGANSEIYFDPSEIVHLRSPLPDPYDNRFGLAPLGAAYREVATDNEAAAYAAVMLNNMGVPGVILSPKQLSAEMLSAGASYQGMSEEEQVALAALWKAKTTGDRRGEALVPSFPMEATTIGFSPKDLNLDVIRDIPEERITALLGIHPAVVGLGSASEKSTYSNTDQYERWSWNHNIVPTARLNDEQLTMQLMPDVVGALEGDAFGRDYSKVKAMREDNNEDIKTLTLAAGQPILTRNEARAMLGTGLSPVEGGDEFPASPDPNAAPDNNANGNAVDTSG